MYPYLCVLNFKQEQNADPLLVPQLDAKEAPSEEEISHLPNSDAAENSSFLTEIEQQKTSSPVSQNAEDFTTLFEEFRRERTMSPLSLEDLATLFNEFEREKTMSPLHKSTTNDATNENYMLT